MSTPIKAFVLITKEGNPEPVTEFRLANADIPYEAYSMLKTTCGLKDVGNEPIGENTLTVGKRMDGIRGGLMEFFNKDASLAPALLYVDANLDPWTGQLDAAGLARRYEREGRRVRVSAIQDITTKLAPHLVQPS